MITLITKYKILWRYQKPQKKNAFKICLWKPASRQGYFTDHKKVSQLFSTIATDLEQIGFVCLLTCLRNSAPNKILYTVFTCVTVKSSDNGSLHHNRVT